MEGPSFEVIDYNYPDYAMDGTLTFSGVLRNYLDERNAKGEHIGIARHWNQDTKRSYMRDYNLRLLPSMEKRKPIDSYQAEDFDVILESLQEKFHYAEATMAHYRHLIWVVCQAGYRHGHCEDILWGTHYCIGEKQDTETAKVESLLKLKKSFSINEELLIFEQLMGNPKTQTGEKVGLLLMFLCGFRNNEACGLNYGDLQPMQEYPEVFCLWNVKSTQIGSNVLKAGGKSKNANRVLPVLDILRDFLLCRMEYLQELVSDQTLQLYEGSIMDLPIACRGMDFKSRCSADDLTRAGRLVFKAVNINKLGLGYLDQLIHATDMQNMGIKEKDPSSYLYRRHLGSMLSALGGTLAQIQYYLGHEVEDPYETRNDFANEDKLYEIKKLIDRHPLNNLNRMSDGVERFGPERGYHQVSNQATQSFELWAEQTPIHIQIQVDAVELGETLGVSIQSYANRELRVLVQEKPCEPVYGRTVHISQQMQKSYRKSDKKLTNMAQSKHYLH